MEISGKRVLITGASRGVGRALAEGFAQAGAQVVLVARSAEPLAEIARRVGGRSFPTDLADPVAVAGLLERVEEQAGPVDVLVNNAGVSHVGYVLDQAPEQVEEVFRTNTLTPIHLCRQAIPRMLARGAGHIVNMASIAAVTTPPGLTVYGASKAALAHYTAGLRLELQGLPIGLTLVQIGSTATQMDDASQRYPPIARLRGSRSVEAVRFPIEEVVAGVLDAVARGRAHVVLPKALWSLAGWVEIPRAALRLAYRKQSPRP